MKSQKNVKKDSDSSKDKSVHFPNLLPLLHQEYRTSMMNTLRNIFLDNLMILIKAEREFVANNKGLSPMMTQEKIDQIQNILDNCVDVYEIQALNDYVLLENFVPTLAEVKSRGLRLRLMYPILEKPLPRR
jgi:hypothetical protein